MSETLVFAVAVTAFGLAVIAAVGRLIKVRHRSTEPRNRFHHGIVAAETLSLPPMGALTPRQFQRVCQLHAILAEADPSNLEEWIAGFEGNSEVEREIRILEAVAATYARITSTVILSTTEKQQLYVDLVFLSYGPDGSTGRPARLPRGAPPWNTIAQWYRTALAGERLP